MAAPFVRGIRGSPVHSVLRSKAISAPQLHQRAQTYRTADIQEEASIQKAACRKSIQLASVGGCIFPVYMAFPSSQFHLTTSRAVIFHGTPARLRSSSVIFSRNSVSFGSPMTSTMNLYSRWPLYVRRFTKGITSPRLAIGKRLMTLSDRSQ